MVSVRLLDVQSGTEAHVESALADISAGFAAAGRPFNEVYQLIRGDLPAYAIFTPDAEFNDLPPTRRPVIELSLGCGTPGSGS
jgi:hypothetical protein